MTGSPLVIGVGNEHRGDDAAGVEVVRRLDSDRVVEISDCSRLLDAWEGEADVIVVDAMRSGRSPGSVLELDGRSQSFPTKSFPSSHSFGLADAVELGRILNRLPHRLTVYGIEALNLDPGDEMSPDVARAVSEVVSAIQES
ncbi:MAG: hydrogenase maturation protease [Actinomycetota bacterium]|nr:hydrogenase maturation protease [Actinomycetota bacterium]